MHIDGKGNQSLTYMLAYMKVIHFKNRMLSSFSLSDPEGRNLSIEYFCVLESRCLMPQG